MLYFFLVPGYLLFASGLAAVAIGLRTSVRHRRKSGFAVGALIGSFAGFVVANGTLWLGIVFAVRVLENTPDSLALPEWVRSAFALVFGAAIFLGPVAASAVGVLCGSVLGLAIVAWRRRRQTSKV